MADDNTMGEERLARIVRAMRIEPGDRILEIGCGFGVSSTLICQQLTTGFYLAIDRSATSIRAAMKRNAAYIEAGRAAFEVADFESFDPGPRLFDRILAVRVRAFHVDPAASRERVQRWLAPGGQLFIEYDEPTRR